MDIVQIKPYITIGSCALAIQMNKEKQVQRLFKKLKVKFPIELTEYNNIIINAGDYSESMEKQFKTLEKLARYLQDAIWYMYEEEKIFQLQIKKGFFSHKQITHSFYDFSEYFQATFPKNKKIILALLSNRIYNNAELSSFMDEEPFKRYEQDVKTVMTIDPKAWSVMMSYGVALSYRKNFKKAIVADRQALKIKHSINAHEDYDSLLLYSNLANDLVADKQYEAGLKCALKAEGISPNRGDYRILEKKAYAYLGLKNFEMVIKTCDKIIQKSLRRDDIAFAFFNKACALTMLQRYGESAASLAAAYTMNSFLPELAENDPENIMIFKLLVKNGQVKDIMGETYKYMEKFS